MSEKNPNWYELPKSRWEEKTNQGERTWWDSQRKKLYRAENAFRNNDRVTFQQFASLVEAQKYADKFLTSAWVVQRWGEQAPVKVKCTSVGDAWYRRRTHEISIKYFK